MQGQAWRPPGEIASKVRTAQSSGVHAHDVFGTGVHLEQQLDDMIAVQDGRQGSASARGAMCALCSSPRCVTDRPRMAVMRAWTEEAEMPANSTTFAYAVL